MNTTFKLDGSTTLRIGNNLMLQDNGEPWAVHPHMPYIALILERAVGNGPGEPAQPPIVSTLATLKPHEARAMASVLLGAATEAK